MADPVSGIMIGSMILGGIGSVAEANAQKKAGAYNAKIHRTNAAIKRKMAKDALQRGDTTEARHRMDVADLKADQRARMLAGGQTLTGSNSAILDDTAFYGEMDALTIRQNAAREAWGHNVEAENYMMQADLAEMGGNNAATSTIITGAAQVGQQYANWAS
jgi:hypothetical protein